MNEQTVGEKLYEEHRVAVGGVEHGSVLPAWADLDADARAEWEAKAKAKKAPKGK